MIYAEARAFMRTGDIVFISGAQTLVRRLIRRVTGGPFFHVGVVIRSEIMGSERIMIAECQPDGLRLVNLSSYIDCDMAVITPSVTSPQAFAEAILSRVGFVSYDFLDFIPIVLRETFNISMPDRFTGRGDVCSVFVARMLKKFGLDVGRTQCSPNWLYGRLVVLGAMQVSQR